MKIKVGAMIWDSKDEMVGVYLTPGERQQIADMAPDARVYAAYPDTIDTDEAREWVHRFKVDADKR